MEKTMIIVGAGIAGLSTGFYAQMNGFDTTIFEMHDIPGGLCTAWTRKGYTFDLSMHFLMNSRKGPLKKLWDELGITTGQEFHYHDRAMVIEGKGKRLDFCMDRQRLEEQMLEISPDDAELIREFLDLFFGESPLGGMSLEPTELIGPLGKIKALFSMLPLLGMFKKYGKLTLQEFASRFKDPFLSMAVRYSGDSPGWPMPKFPLLFMAGSASSTVLDSGYPLGGSKKAVLGIAERFKKLGGKISYKSRVKDLIIENGTAVGVKLENGSVYKADVVVWAADGHHLIFDILKEKYMDENIRKMYREWTVVKPVVHVMFGVDMDLSREPHRMVLELQRPINVANKEFPWINILSHCFDKSTAPSGKSAIEVWFDTDYEYWEELIKNRNKYDMEKKRIAGETADALDTHWPGFKSKIEMVDVPTPMTYVRYTGNWRGSPDGWYATVDNFMDQSMRRTLAGLNNFYMVGQWTAPYTGTVLTSLGGRQLIQILCKKGGRHFTSSVT